MSYDPNSVDAMFGKVMTRLDEQDRSAGKTNADFLLILTEIRTEARKTNGRVTTLETNEAVNRGRVAILATCVSAVVGAVGWFASHFMGKP